MKRLKTGKQEDGIPPVLNSGKLSSLLWKYFSLVTQITKFFVS